MEHLITIRKKAETLLRELPPQVALLAAAKTRTPEEVQAAYEGGIRFFGHNYVQEAQTMRSAVSFDARWHMIGHLQRNKAGNAVELFDMIESLDSVRLAEELEKRCAAQNKIMDVLIEVNSGSEDNKTGVFAGEVPELVEVLRTLPHLKLAGLMTMGPLSGDPDRARPFFRKTKELFETLNKKMLPDQNMQILSMGMSSSYKVAIEEGATLVRIGTLLFGPRS